MVGGLTTDLVSETNCKLGCSEEDSSTFRDPRSVCSMLLKVHDAEMVVDEPICLWPNASVDEYVSMNEEKKWTI